MWLLRKSNWRENIPEKIKKRNMSSETVNDRKSVRYNITIPTPKKQLVHTLWIEAVKHFKNKRFYMRWIIVTYVGYRKVKSHSVFLNKYMNIKRIVTRHNLVKIFLRWSHDEKPKL
jgi:hypothetical protein